MCIRYIKRHIYFSDPRIILTNRDPTSSYSASRGLMSARVFSARRWPGDIGDVWNIPTQLLRRLLSLSLLFVRVLFFRTPTRVARNHLFGRESRRRDEAFFRQTRREKIDSRFWVTGCQSRIFIAASCSIGNLILSRNDGANACANKGWSLYFRCYKTHKIKKERYNTKCRSVTTRSVSFQNRQKLRDERFTVDRKRFGLWSLAVTFKEYLYGAFMNYRRFVVPQLRVH